MSDGLEQQPYATAVEWFNPDEPENLSGVDQREEMEMSEKQKEQSPYERLAAINVNQHVEKKGKFSYLSWTWAVDTLLRQDPHAQWAYDEPRVFGETLMVSCTVVAFGISRTMQLPVMSDNNKALANPDAFAINKAMQRCLVKAIALHGLGLYIYAGEDLPADEAAKPEEVEESAELTKAEKAVLTELTNAAAEGSDRLKAAWKKVPEKTRVRLTGELEKLQLKEVAAKNDAAKVTEKAAA